MLIFVIEDIKEPMNEIQYEWQQPIEKTKKHHLQAYHELNPQCECIKLKKNGIR